MILQYEEHFKNTYGSEYYFGTYYICANALINDHADVPSEAIGLKVGLIIHFSTYFMCASSEGSCDSAHMRRLASAFAAR